MRSLAVWLAGYGIARSRTKEFNLWSRTVTTEGIHDLLAELMASGHYYEQPRSFTSAELGFIKQLLDTFPVDKADELDIDDIHSHLYRNHPSIQENVQAAYPVILILIYSHCSFPFASQVPLTKDALIRSLGLLTTRSNNLFKPLRYKAEYSIQERTLTSKTEFLFSALAQPNPCTGVPKIDDILDIVSRVEYPHTLNPCMAPRRPLSHLYPTADRLLASSSDTELPSREILTVSTTVLEPLADLCKVIRDDDKVEGESLLAGKDSLTQEEFLQWATAVSLHLCLDKLFGVFFPARTNV